MSVRTSITYSNPVERARDGVEIISAARTLTAADSRRVFILDATEGATVTLPALEDGLTFEFFVGAAFASTNWVIASAEGDNISGNIIVNGSIVQAAAEDFINFVATAESVGDFVKIFADSGNSQWIVWGIGNTVGSITATDPA